MLNFEKIVTFYNNSKIDTDENILKAIRKDGIYKATFNKSVIDNTKNTFNIELPNVKIYNQDESYSCWIYAYISFIKPSICKKLNISDEDLDISVNYIHFFDRLEKSNSLYEEIINNNITIEDSMDDDLVNQYIHTCGAFDNAKDIIKKYGIVPENEMPMNRNNFEPLVVDKIFKEKVKKDIFEILKLDDINEKNRFKEKCLEENYTLLSKIFGRPPLKFDFKYKDINKKEVKYESISPKQFLDICITDNLDDYIFIMNDNSKEFYKQYEYNDFKEIYDNKHFYYNLPLDVIKQSITEQLKNGIPVWFGCDFRAVCGSYTNKPGILDSNLFDLEDVLGIKILPKLEQIKFKSNNYHHAMIIVGAQIKNNIPIRWKVQNSFGKENNQDGYFVMNENYFNEYATMFGINKKYIKCSK